jgi:geranylgeranyl pyrophosphate synthase
LNSVKLSDEATAIRLDFEAFLQSHVEKYYNQKDILGDVLRYALAGQGKRIRPLMTLLACHDLGHDYRHGFNAAIALEWMHTYSLIHDDLPCMDDDDSRRGRPTLHRQFNDGYAVLAGDALLTDSFECLTKDPSSTISDGQKLAMIRELAVASGSRGMVWGQSQDLYWTARRGGTRDLVEAIHQRKTGDLLGAACAIGAIIARNEPTLVQLLREIGRKVGLAYQILDDLLDNDSGIGKTSGKDHRHQKLTVLVFLSEQQARLRARDLTEQVITSLESINLGRGLLSQLISVLLRRKN